METTESQERRGRGWAVKVQRWEPNSGGGWTISGMRECFNRDELEGWTRMSQKENRAGHSLGKSVGCTFFGP